MFTKNKQMSNTTTTDEIIEGNKLIAVFDGKDRLPDRYYQELNPDLSWYGKNCEYNYVDIFSENDLKYNTSWDWLMPVVEKIEKIEMEFHGYFGVYISSNNCTIQGSRLITTKRNFHPAYFADHYGNTKIEATWLAVVNFIKWYNNQNK